MQLTRYTIERPFPVSVDRLWAGFTDPALLKQWIWGPGAKDVRVEQDLQLYGMFNVSMAAEDTRWGMRGIYVEIQPGKKLVHTLHWDADVGYNRAGKHPVDEVIVVEILSDGDVVSLRYTHVGIPDDGQSAKEHERSVRVTLDLLEKVLA